MKPNPETSTPTPRANLSPGTIYVTCPDSGCCRALEATTFPRPTSDAFLRVPYHENIRDGVRHACAGSNAEVAR